MNTGAAWLREMVSVETDGNREFDLMSHVFRALDPKTRSNCVEPSGRAQEGSSADLGTAGVGDSMGES